LGNIPAGISVNRNTAILTIEWKDGHIGEYPFTLLRAACPCVGCRGGHDQMSDKPDPEVFTISIIDSEKTRIVNVMPVGSYAISIQWEDSHSAGIYHWDFLRFLCTCPACRDS